MFDCGSGFHNSDLLGRTVFFIEKIPDMLILNDAQILAESMNNWDANVLQSY